MWKSIERFLLAGPLKSLYNSLVANRTANIATIESLVGGGTVSVNTAVTNFITAESAKSPVLAIFAPEVEPELISVLTELEAKGVNTVPEYYDAAVAFVLKEETEV